MTEAFLWFLLSGVLMVAVALVGGVTLALSDAQFGRLRLPLVSFSAGSLLGGAFFHMLPAAVDALGNRLSLYAVLLAGFSLFFLLEQLLHWHHCHREQTDCRQPVGTLMLLGDAVHNALGGLAIAGSFLIDVRLGFAAWLAALAHEIPQELGEYGVLVHGGWSRSRALLMNAAAALPFPLVGSLAFAVSGELDTSWLVPFAAGNFVYIAASDLVPEVNRHHGWQRNAQHVGAFLAGMALLLTVRGWIV